MTTTPTTMPELFGSLVFTEETMQQRLSPASYAAWKKCITDGTSLDISIANEIAEAMKQWATEKGCTHLLPRILSTTLGRHKLKRPRSADFRTSPKIACRRCRLGHGPHPPAAAG